jgi:hypothetical protein
MTTRIETAKNAIATIFKSKLMTLSGGYKLTVNAVKEDYKYMGKMVSEYSISDLAKTMADVCFFDTYDMNINKTFILNHEEKYYNEEWLHCAVEFAKSFEITGKLETFDVVTLTSN